MSCPKSSRYAENEVKAFKGTENCKKSSKKVWTDARLLSLKQVTQKLEKF